MPRKRRIQKKHSWVYRFKENFGFIAVPENKIRPVFVDEHFDHFKDSGQYWRHGFRRTWGAPIYLGFREKDTAVISGRTSDGQRYEVELHCVYSYDPRNALFDYHKKLARADAHVIDDYAIKRLEIAARNVLNSCTESDARNGLVRQKLAVRINKYWEKSVKEFGIKPLELVSITDLTFPDRLEEFSQIGKGMMNLGTELQHASPELFDHAMHVIKLRYLAQSNAGLHAGVTPYLNQPPNKELPAKRHTLNTPDLRHIDPDVGGREYRDFYTDDIH